MRLITRCTAAVRLPRGYLGELLVPNARTVTAALIVAIHPTQLLVSVVATEAVRLSEARRPGVGLLRRFVLGRRQSMVAAVVAELLL